MYVFYLNEMVLPITPSKLTTKIGGRNSTMDLVNGGEINLIKFPKLTEYSFEFELYHNMDNIKYKASEVSPKQVLDLLEDAKKKKKVIKFSVLRKMGNSTRFALEQKVTVESYEVVEDSDNNSDITVSIELKQFRAYRTKHIGSNKPPANPTISNKDTGKKDDKKSTERVLKKIEITTGALNIRNDAGTSNKVLSTFKKGEKPCVYGEKKVNGITWYKIKHSASKDGFAWISGNGKYSKVLQSYK